MQKVRVGLLGVSWWTEVVWPGFSIAENAEITWVAARNGEKARDFAEKNGIGRWTDNYLELMGAPDVDAVFVGVPNYLHEEMALAALAKGKHVLQEKPMALTVEKAIAQKRIADHRGLVLMVDQELRLADGVRDLPDMIESRIGPLRKVVIGLTLAPSHWEGWRADPKLCGGTLFEMVIHELDLARWLWKRDPLKILAMGDDVPGKDLTILLDFGHGDSALIDVCWRSIGFRIRAECYGERGYILREAELPFGAGKQTIVTADGREESGFEASVQGQATFKRVLETFCESILSGCAAPISSDDGVWAVRMAQAARESLRTGHAADLSGVIKPI